MLEIENLEAGYGGLPILKGVSLRIGRNESVAIIGANGAGQSTLVQAICGLIPATSGRIVQQGREIHHLPAHERAQRGIAVVLEGRRLFGELTVRQNLMLALAHGMRRGADQQIFSLERILELFAFMSGRLDARVELLSGGEQQMVAIARALLLQPEVLIMDEDATGVAPKVGRDIVEVIERLRAGGMSVILVEQNVAIAAQTSERAYVMSLGKLVYEIAPGGWDDFRNNEALVRAYLGGQ